MHIAAKYGHYLIVKYLVEIGANALITNKDGFTPFDFADDSRKQIEMQLANSKNKIGGPGFKVDKAYQTLENLHSIQRFIAKHQE